MVSKIKRIEPQQASRMPSMVFGGPQRQYRYQPLPDITTFELSEAMMFLHTATLVTLRMLPPVAVDAMYDKMSEGTKRHFQTNEKSPLLVPRGANGN